MQKKILISVGVASCLLVLLLRQVDVRQLGIALVQVHFGFLTIGLATQVATMWIKSIRWSVAIRGATGQHVRRAFSASVIGFAGNLLLPARLGELARVSVIDKHNQIGRPLALITVGILQLVDLLLLVLCFILLSFFASNLFMKHRWSVSLVGVAALLFLGGLFLLQQNSQPLRALLLPIHYMLPNALKQRASSYADLCVKGLGLLGQSRVVSRVLILTIATWTLDTVAIYIMLQAFHIETTLLVAGMLVVVLSLSFAVSITPGNIGIHQALSVILLSSVGIAPVSALAFSIGTYGTTFLLTVTLGLICLYSEGMNLNLFRSLPHHRLSEKVVPSQEILG